MFLLKSILDNTIQKFSSILKTGLQKIVFNVKSSKDVLFARKKCWNGNVVPVFQISTITEHGLEDLKTFLSKLTIKLPNIAEFSLIKTPKDKTEMLLDHTFNTKIGCIDAGAIVSGKIEVNQKLLL